MTIERQRFTLSHIMPVMPADERAAYVAAQLRELAAQIETRGLSGKHENVPAKDAHGYTLGTYAMQTETVTPDGKPRGAMSTGEACPPTKPATAGAGTPPACPHGRGFNCPRCYPPA